MNYRHIYHAGNFADVLKHLILTIVIGYMERKSAPFRVVDTHAGAGLYDLRSFEAQKTGEWREGIGRLLNAEIPPELTNIIGPYLDVVGRFGSPDPTAPGTMTCYPGSPLIACELLRPKDTLIANELHPEDGKRLEKALSVYRNARTLSVDGYAALKAVLPPKERRGLVLVDPPFERPGELERLIEGLRQGVRRFATGTYLCWYPIKDPRPIANFKQELSGLELAKLWQVDFYVRAPVDVERFNGHGLIVLNPPFTLMEELELALPFLVKILAQGEGAHFRLATL